MTILLKLHGEITKEVGIKDSKEQKILNLLRAIFLESLSHLCQDLS